MSKYDGGPAFPGKYYECGPEGEPMTCVSVGMSLRDYLAAKVAAGLCACVSTDHWGAEELSEKSYQIADAMLAERAK